MRISTFAQFAALCLAVAAIMWSLALAEWVLFPRVWRVDRPSRAHFLHRQHIFGLIALTTGIVVKHGSRRLRRACIIASIFALVMPSSVSSDNLARRPFHRMAGTEITH